MEGNVKLTKTLELLVKIFFIGLLLQFVVQTFVNYGLGWQSGRWNLVRMRKELLILALLAILVYVLQHYQKILIFWSKFPLRKFVSMLILTLIVTFIVSVFITSSGLGTYMISVRYSMIGFFIFAIFFAVSRLFFSEKQEKLFERYTNIMKRLLLGSVCWWVMIWLVPRTLEFVGYNQYNFEGAVGISPPAAYYTQYNDGFVRNQFLFERPISRGFFLIALWPLFFVLVIRNKGLKNTLGWGSLYTLAILSTFSRAAWIAWIVQTIVLLLMQYRKQFWKLTLYLFLPCIFILVGITYVGRQQIIERDFSNTGHTRGLVEALSKFAEKPFWGQGAGSAGPASYQLKDGNKYNPENQYLQILLEYGIFGFLGWIYLYLYLHLVGWKAYQSFQNSKTTKQTKYHAMIVMALGIGILGLSIEGLVLHSFVDRMIVYPFMALFGIAYAIYYKYSVNKTQNLEIK